MAGQTPFRDRYGLIYWGTFAERPASGARDQLYFVSEGDNAGKIYHGTGSGWALLPLQTHTHAEYALGGHNHDGRYSLLAHTHDPTILDHGPSYHAGVLERMTVGFSMFCDDEIPVGADLWHETLSEIAISGTVVKINSLRLYLHEGPTEAISVVVKLGATTIGTFSVGVGEISKTISLGTTVVTDSDVLKVDAPADWMSARGARFHACLFRVRA